MNANADQHAPGDAKVILIIDDEPDIATTFVMLFDYHGFQVITAGNGQEALDILNDCTPDVILSDYMMPLMNGVELCGQLKVDPRFSSTLFILTSGALPPGEVGAAPYDVFMPKPISFNNLLAEINRFFAP
jgi:CheY-like chemotaxis protein